jgi:Glycosyl hydrolase family 10
MRFILMLFGLLVVTGCNAASSTISLVPQEEPAKFNRTFFGMHVHNNGIQRNWPDVLIGSIRLWDARVTWASLEEQRGVWQFARLDEYVSWAKNNNIEVLLPLGVTPRWASARPGEKGAYGPGSAAEPADVELWRTYVRTVVQRYKGRVAAYEIWNEANIPAFYSGSVMSLIELIRVAREEINKHDPSVRLVAPSGVGLDQRVAWPSQIMQSGAADFVDIASFHLYHSGQAPEAMIEPVGKMKAKLQAAGYGTIPLWNTEAGYWFANPQVQWTPDESRNLISSERAAEYLPRDLLLARALGFERYYWYAWDNAKMGFRDPATGVNRSVAKVLSQFTTTLMRATLHRCDRNSAGLWSCRLTGANGGQLAALWIDPSARLQQQNISTPLPGKFMLLDGISQWQPAPANLRIGPMVLLVSDQK